MNEGDYIFSIPEMYEWDETPSPIRTAEVITVTATRAQLDNGAAVKRKRNGGGHYGHWVEAYGNAKETFDFERRSTLVWVRREDYGAKLKFWTERRVLELRVLQLTRTLNQQIEGCQTVEQLSKVEGTFITPLRILTGKQLQAKKEVPA